MSIAYRCDGCGELIPGPMVVELPRVGKRRVYISNQLGESFDLCIDCLGEKIDYDFGDEK